MNTIYENSSFEFKFMLSLGENFSLFFQKKTLFAPIQKKKNKSDFSRILNYSESNC
ncbi:hypothetical protein SAMN05444274_104436 [Mariniphaga anaerophila]|uniref:Uncharacterized protein n=1 Tax=Mariniphaga anaerophila TaxID=1484053 RepID=A0A1M5AR82_9BACT|nr:hypothetical protein SAMN05444274_104436 [Mariniphaga anaerophila]